SDLLADGIYIRKSKNFRPNDYSSPIAWRKTFGTHFPFIKGSEIMYLDTVHNKRRRDSADFFHLLHVSCLKEIFASLGERSSISEIDGLEPHALSLAARSPKSFLRPFRERIYDERGRRLVAMIQSYLGGGRLRQQILEVEPSPLAYTGFFENIWEHVLRE